MRDELERVVLPDADGARERARRVVTAALQTREPVTPRRRRWPLAVAIAAAILAAALATSPGRAVLDEIREVVGVERAQPALFSLPGRGRLLVASDAGVWVVQHDGSRRLLGPYREASWSPYGRYVVATRANELAALEPDGGVRWTLARRDVRSPRWTGSRTDTRIAYLDRSGIRVVAGDGTDDRLLSPERGRIAWRPDRRTFELASLQASELRLQDGDTGRVVRRAHAGTVADVLDLSWAPSGRFALVVHPWELTTIDVRRNVAHSYPFRAADVKAAAYSPDGRSIAVLRRSRLVVVDTRTRATRELFAGAGSLRGLAWSPDGRWLLVGWPAADQWVFVRADGKRIHAVSNVSAQFRSRSFPRIEGWCCA